MVGILSAPVLSFATKAIGGIFGNDKTREDPSRLAANNAAYNRALTGDRNAILYLQGRTGTLGKVHVPAAIGVDGTPGSIEGWATQRARDDAIVKLTALGQAAGPTPQAPTQSALQQELTRVGNAVRTDIAESVQRIGSGAVTAATGRIAPADSRQAGAITIPTDKRTLILAGVVLVALAIAIALLARR